MPDLTFRVGADIRGLRNALADARREVARGIGSIGGAGSLLTGAGLAAAGTKAVTDYVEKAKEIAKLAQLANASIAEASKLLATGEQFGVTSDKMGDAIRNVSQAAASSPDLFREIGVALEDANGNARRSVDIFGDVRNVMSTAQGDYRLTAGAAKILGRSVEELIPFLRASEMQVQNVAVAAERMGLVMSEDAVRGAIAYSASLQAAQAQGEAFTRQLAGQVIPMLANVAEAAMTAGDMLGALFSTPAQGTQIGRMGIPVISGLVNGLFNTADALTGTPTDALRRINDEVNAKAKLREDFKKLAQANLLGSGGGAGGFAFPDLNAGKASGDALRERIDVIREEAEERERTMRRALDAFEKERRSAIDTIEAEQDAREQQHELELRAIEDETRARDEAFEAADRAREDEISGLREQIRATSELIDLEEDRRDIAEAEKNLAHERAVVVTREGFKSARDYYAAVNDQNRRVRESEEKLADARKRLEQDTTRATIEARIRAIEDERQSQRRALEDYRKIADERIRKIRDQMAVEKEQSDRRVAQLQAEIDKERERVTTAIQALEDLTRATLKNLNDQLKAHQAAGAGIAAAYPNINRTISYTDGGGGANVGGGGQDLAQRRGEQQAGGQLDLHSARALKESLLGRNASYEEYAGYVGRTKTSVENEIKQSAEYQMRTAIAGGMVGGSMLVHDYPHRLTFNEPTLMVGMKSGRALGAAAVSGSETFETAGVGGGGRGGLTVNMPLYVTAGDVRSARSAAHTEIDAAFTDLEERLAGENSYGFRRTP